MGMFDGIESVQSSQGGAWLLPGQHLLKINALKAPDNLRSGECFIGEFTVVETNNEKYSIGQSVSWIRNVTKHKEMAQADIKAFLAAVANIPEENVDSAGAQAAVSETQPFAGKLVRCEAFQRPTKSGGEFTRTIWTPHEGE